MIGIIYGSSMGNTKEVAENISRVLNLENEILNVADICPQNLDFYSSLIVGTSTWYDGELQDDWENFDFSGLNLNGKTVAIFGLGDGFGYADTFCDAMADLYEGFVKAGAKIIGETSTLGYEFEESRAVKDDKFIGLALDNENQSNLTEERIKNWINKIKPELI